MKLFPHFSKDLLRRLNLRVSDWFLGIGLPILLASLDSISVAMIFPILTFIEKGPAGFDAGGNQVLIAISQTLEFLGFELSLPALLLPVLFVLSFRYAVEYAVKMFSTKLTASKLIELRIYGLHKYLHAGIAFFLNTSPGSIQNTFDNESRRVARIPAMAIDCISKLLMIVGYFLLMLAISWQLTLWNLALISVCAGLLLLLMRKAKRLGGQLTEIQIRMTSLHLQSIQNVRLLKVTSSDRGIEEKLRVQIVEEQENNIAVQRMLSIVRCIGGPIAVVVVALLAYIAINQLTLPVASLGLFLVLGMRSTGILTEASNAILLLRHTMEGIPEFNRIIGKALAAVPPKDGSAKFECLESDIAFESVSFVYRTDDGETHSLNNVSFKVPARKTTALVGRSGSGKTTATDILARLCDPESGRVLVDGRDLRDFSIASYRRRVAVVSQSETMLDMNVRDNVCLGLDRPLEDEQIWEVLAQAHADDFVRAFPSGLDTQLGDRGCRMSGGQRQRLAFARALAGRPEILILDEPTSALDAPSEAAIAQTLAGLVGKVTVVVVAHRLATIRAADQIVLLHEGRVVDVGRHDELERRQPSYRTLFGLKTAA
jgi:ATP-binding cassette, subfamily B, bacterial MsbA